MNRRSLMSMLLASGGYCVFPKLIAREHQTPSSLRTGGDRPRLGVYLGAGCSGTQRLPEYERWLRRDVDQTLEFLSWDVLKAGTTWAVKCWRNSHQAAVVYSVPMLPPNRSATLAEGAQGRFDDLFRRYAQLLVAQGYGDSIIRIGWEFNATWYAWAASKDPQSWIAYWRRIVSLMRETPESAFRFDWNVAAAAQGFSADLAYPGDDVVDFIGMDFYNMPIKGAKSDSPRERWDARLNMQHGLKWHRDFARAHGKPMSLPEWGTGKHAKYGGPTDDAYFIERMASWIADNRIGYHNYWDYRNKQFDSKLSDGSQPEAAAAYVRFFGSGTRAAHRESAHASAVRS